MESSEKKRTVELKKAEVLQAATELFSEKSYEATTMSEIAKRAGVSFGSVASYYGNKESLFTRCVELPLKELSESFLNFDLHPVSFADELQKMMKGHFELFQNMKVFLRLVVQVIAQHERFPNQFNLVVEQTAFIQDEVTIFIQNGQQAGQFREGDASRLSIVYINLLFGTILSYAFRPSQEDEAEFISFAIRMFGPV
ncbi:TetR/AcrR family transcriptional regulator [Metabacillus malikii]|nr:TetR/AcrR family transcriptional regulator [Metabacillus malikii]